MEGTDLTFLVVFGGLGVLTAYLLVDILFLLVDILSELKQANKYRRRLVR